MKKIFLFATIVMSVLGIICMALPAAAETIETIALSGIITAVVAPPPDPFFLVEEGDTWTLSYTFDTSIGDVDPNPDAGQYQNAVTQIKLTIGSATVAGNPAEVLPSGHGSFIFVYLGTDNYADYSAQIGLPNGSNGSGWAQVLLWDDGGTPFANDSLPAALPMPLSEMFPSGREFFLRKPNSTAVFLMGELVEGPQPEPYQPVPDKKLFETDFVKFNLVFDAQGNSIDAECVSGVGCKVTTVQLEDLKIHGQTLRYAPYDKPWGARGSCYTYVRTRSGGVKKIEVECPPPT